MTQEIGPLSSVMTTRQRDGSQVLQKNSPWLENWQDCFKKVCISKGKREKYNEKFSKINTLRNRRRRISAVWPSAFCKGLRAKEVRHPGQREGHLKCSQAEEKVKATWSGLYVHPPRLLLPHGMHIPEWQGFFCSFPLKHKKS